MATLNPPPDRGNVLHFPRRVQVKQHQTPPAGRCAACGAPTTDNTRSLPFEKFADWLELQSGSATKVGGLALVDLARQFKIDRSERKACGLPPLGSLGALCYEFRGAGAGILLLVKEAVRQFLEATSGGGAA